MARTATLVDMRTRAYQRGDFESSTARFPAAEVTAHINESIADLYDKLVRARGTSYYETTTTWTMIVGTSTYALPAGFFELLAVSYYDGFNKYELIPFARPERPYLSDTNVGWTGYPYYYRLTAGNIEVLPAPQSTSHVLTAIYVPTAPKLVNDSDTFDGIDGWEEWVIVDAARKMATKERDTALVQMLEADRARLDDRIKALAGARDRHMPKRVVDVRYGRLETMGRRRVPR